MTFVEFIEEWKSDSPVIKARTSGSTGKPKEIELEKDFVRQSALRTIRFFGLDDRSRFHSCVGADYIGGKMMAVRAIELGARFTYEIPSNRPLCGVVKNGAIDLLAVVPSQMVYILDNIEYLPAINNIIVGGSAIPVELRKRIAESSLNVFETYGMTETASHIALRKVGEKELWFNTLPGIEVSLDERGCLVIKFESGERYVTNDLAEINEEGGFRITGRTDFVIVTGGKKMNPIEIEEKLQDIVAKPFIIKGEPDEKWGQKVVMIVESEDYVDTDMLKEMISPMLEHWQIPKAIRMVEQLPRTPNGKLKRT